MEEKEKVNKKKLENDVIDMLKTVFDPEIPVDIYELGLVYDIRVDDQAHVHVLMTLTTPSCPVAESLPAEVEQKTGAVDGVKTAKVELTFDPPWDKDMMSEEAQFELGFL